MLFEVGEESGEGLLGLGWGEVGGCGGLEAGGGVGCSGDHFEGGFEWDVGYITVWTIANVKVESDR